MKDEVTYETPDNKVHNLFAEPPVYLTATTQKPTITSQSNDTDMVFKASVEGPQGCTECVVVLHQTYHPSWRTTIDGKPVPTMTVFPFYIAVSITEGTHEVVFSYRPSSLKIGLLIVSILSLCALLWLARPNGLKKIKA